MNTHTEKGIPIVPTEVVRKVMEAPVIDIEKFAQEENEIMDRLEIENPNLHKAILAQCAAAMTFGDLHIAKYMRSAQLSIIKIIENSEESYRKG